MRSVVSVLTGLFILSAAFADEKETRKCRRF